jgi:hypothetical protein
VARHGASEVNKRIKKEAPKLKRKVNEMQRETNSTVKSVAMNGKRMVIKNRKGKNTRRR